MGHIVLHAVFLVLSSFMQGSRAVTPVFVLRGSDVQLDVKEAVSGKFSLLVWSFNRGNNLASFSPTGELTVYEAYNGRVELVEKFSVKLKNVQETDSGVYAARVIGNKDQILAEYKVTVQAPVSPVNLTVDSVSSSSDSCNLTVTCRTRDSNISSTFTCVNQTCSEDGDRSENTTSGAVFHVYLENDSIKCNHSNQVNWTINQGATRIQDFCHQQPKDASHVTVYVVVSVVIIIVIIIAAICYRKKRQTETIFHMDTTVYAVPEVPTGQTLQMLPISDDSNISPNSTYCIVGSHPGPRRSAGTGQALPQSAYAEVNQPD